MESEMNHETDDFDENALAMGNASRMSLEKGLPKRSKVRYEIVLKQFMKWQESLERPSFSEEVLLSYFQEISKQYSPATLWAHYSMLKNTLLVHKNVDIHSYCRLRSLLKRNAAGYKPKKTKIFTKKEINDFLTRAPDDEHLLNKVVLAFGVCGACRISELVSLATKDIETLTNNQNDTAALVHVNDSKTRKDRTFTLTGQFFEVYQRYAALRPDDFENPRFFVLYQKGRCRKQLVGKNKMANIPHVVAEYLKLPDPNLYTGHCLRRTAVTIFANAGRDLLQLRNLGEWKSSVDDDDDEMAQIPTEIIRNPASTTSQPGLSNSNHPSTSSSNFHLGPKSNENNIGIPFSCSTPLLSDLSAAQIENLKFCLFMFNEMNFISSEKITRNLQLYMQRGLLNAIEQDELENSKVSSMF